MSALNRSNSPLAEHVTLAGRRLTALAVANPAPYAADPKTFEDYCVNSMPSAIQVGLRFGDFADLPPSDLTPRELGFAWAILIASELSYRLRISVAGQALVKAAVAEFARRLAAIHTSQDALSELELA